MMKKNILFVLAGGIIAIVAGVIIIDRARAQAGGCDTQSAQVIGYTNGNNPVTVEPGNMQGVDIDQESGDFALRLREKGANFVSGSGYNVTSNYRMTGAAADFNGDGYVDLVEGGRGCDNTAPSTDSNISIFISRGKDPNNPQRFKFDSPYYLLYAGSTLNKTYEIIACGAGDYDKDGDADIAVLSWQGRLFIFKNLYIENGLEPGGTPVFNTSSPVYLGDLINDGYGEFGSSESHFRWESNIESVDIDGDGDLDLVVGVPTRWASSRWGEVVIFINNGAGVFSRQSTSINPYPNNSNYIYGVCGVAAADFDSDGDIDFYVGSANSRDIYFYRNEGGVSFKQISSKTITIDKYKGTTTMLRAGDLDGYNGPDIVLATDGHNINTPGGYVFWFSNNGAGVMTQNKVPTNGAQVSSSGDLDSGAVGDFDKDGDVDFFVADGNDSQNCYFFMNETFPLYVDQGSVYSINLLPCSFITSDNAIVSVTMSVMHNVPSGTTITYYLSNSNDDNGNPLWEGPVTPGVEFWFKAPGWFLRWKAALTSSDEKKTPRISYISLNYKYIGKREYSRTSHAFAYAEVNSSHQGPEEVLFSASFEFPSWRGHLRSWDLTDMTLQSTKGSTIQEIKEAGASNVVDAGEVLTARSWSSRQVYTAEADVNGIMNQRLNFNTSSVSSLEPYLGLGIDSPESVPLIEFVLGRNHVWKLGDINHSSPQVLEPPKGNPALMGAGYDGFKAEKAERARRLLVGANDGMFHCFDPETLTEQWAFIPNNLLYKLKKMRVRDAQCGEYLVHHSFVDGTATIADVYFNSSWHTIAVCGQGPGWGKDYGWYYFCLDVTDPDDPLPLWEFNDPDSTGETWSVPAVGKLPSDGRWVAFFGSGYDTDGDPDVVLGNHFYCLDIANGQVLFNKLIKDSPEPTSPYGIQNTIPGSPALADTNNDGAVDAVYFGDLLGRIWKIVTTAAPNTWNPAAIYKDPYKHPIITRPAVEINRSDNSVYLYFGTGGDESAPADAYYSFIALNDKGSSPAVTWFIGTAALAQALGIDASLGKETFSLGEKVWADPIISDGVIYIATINGSIENINPCLTLGGAGHLYARYTTGVRAGTSALTNASGQTIASLATLQKARSAVTIGATRQVGNETKRQVFIQSYTQPGLGGPEPPSEVLSQPVPIGNKLRVKSWREVYQVMR
ncbi:MAG: PilC/PilY family type IV pilus protein [Acidobacteriota bacterium]|nr:PilC/PilY family type IV pilus protein [Acidobacteriota bacterium]